MRLYIYWHGVIHESLCLFASAVYICVCACGFHQLVFGFHDMFLFGFNDNYTVNVVSTFVLPVAIDKCTNCKEVPKNGQQNDKLIEPFFVYDIFVTH